MADKKQRIAFIDVVRVVAMFMVVWLHVAAVPILGCQSGSASWLVAVFFCALSRAAVPLFIMISGYLLLNPDYEYTHKSFFFKRFCRVIVPFAVWNVVYIAWRTWYLGQYISLPYAIRAVYEDRVAYHFWFVYVITGLYLVTPILRVFVGNARKEHLYYFIALWLVGASLLPLFNHVLGLSCKLNIPVASHYVGYFIAGHALRNVSLDRRQGLLAGLIFLACAVATGIGVWGLTMLRRETDQYFFNNHSPTVMVMALALFCIIKSVDWERRVEGSAVFIFILGQAAPAVYGAYLMHVIVLKLLADGVFGFSLDGMMLHPVISIPVTTIVAYAITMMLAVLIRKIPVVGKLLA